MGLSGDRVIRILVLAGLLSAVMAPQASPSDPGEAEICLGCHEDPDLAITFTDGRTMPLFVDGTSFRRSVHGRQACSTCHADISAAAHPERDFDSAWSFRMKAVKVCRQCHGFEQGIHRRLLDGPTVFVCTDCHGSHAVEPVAEMAPCLGCHEHNLTLTLENGQDISLGIDPVEMAESAHGMLACDDCHFGFSPSEHPKRRFADQRALTIASADICRRCHFDKYTKSLEGIHYDLLAHGRTDAPSCPDCHGSHGISAGTLEKRSSARRCEKCHEAIYGTYAQSVHGKALLSEGNQDVPVCSDCHRAHDIVDPRTASFLNATPELCGRCHADTDLMARYGLHTNVLKSYLEDFHGVTLNYYRKHGTPAGRRIASCPDCHGIHDITPVRSENAAVVKANLLRRCRKCHPDATENFPDAWLSHYTPSLKRAPLVYAVVVTYRVLIPFMVIGLILQILLHIWRYAVNR